MHFSSALLVAAGGAIGCVLRFWSVQLVIRLHPAPFPLGTLLVNVLGSFLIGVVLARLGAEHSMRAFIVSGVLGGFTTFSAFSWDTFQLLQRGHYGEALLYVGASVLCSLAAVAIGFSVGR
jgi:CrcB protein